MGRVVFWALAVLACALASCAETPTSNLPPSETDLPLLKTIKLCDPKDRVLQRYGAAKPQRHAWGAGEELRIPREEAESGAEESFFFDDDGQLVGALFVFPGGLKLKPYPVLRKTLSELKPEMEFYLRGLAVADRSNLDTSTLFMTGDEKTTTQYITLGKEKDASLLLASMAIDPYSRLLRPYNREFLARVGGGRDDGREAGGKPADSDQPFPAMQQFARGQTAQLAYCGAPDYARAARAYEKTLGQGLTDKTMQAETHHRLGVALSHTGDYKRAEREITEALTLRPNTPDIINNLGDLYVKMGERDKATAAFEKAVSLRPNYPLARFNLAGMYELMNPKRALSEYETYLALVEGVPEEADREAKAKQRVKALKGK